jgi:protocatechuate 4,5-dioxygenase alpha subunit
MNSSQESAVPATSDPLEAPQSYLFGLTESRRGYRINVLARSMRVAENRKAFTTDEAGYMTRLGLSPEEQALVLQRDWLGLQAAGGNQYTLVKLAGALGLTLVQEAAAVRGETVEQFLAGRPMNLRTTTAKG